MRSTLAAAGLVLAIGFAPGQDKPLAKYVSKEGKYAVQFPATPTVETRNVGGIELTSATAQKGSAGYVLVYSDLPPEVAKNSTPKEILANGVSGIITNFKAKVTMTKNVDHGKQKYPSREIVAEKDEGEKGSIHLRIQLVLADHRLYQLIVAGQKDAISGKEGDEFFKSFEISK